MFKKRFFVLIFLLIALPAEVVYSEATICAETGFFLHFMNQWMNLTGTCNDRNGQLRVVLGPGGPEIEDFADNDNLRMKFKNDIKATAENVNLNGWPDNTLKVKILNASKFKGKVTGDVNCSFVAKGGRSCAYTVTLSLCSGVDRGDLLCAPCDPPCKDYRDETITVFVQGRPTFECQVKLDREKRNCIPCRAKAIAVKEEED